MRATWLRYGHGVLVCLPLWIGTWWIVDTCFGHHGWTKRARLLDDEMILVRSNEQLAAQVHRLTHRVQGLLKRPQVQQQVVRDVLGWMYPQDILIELEDLE